MTVDTSYPGIYLSEDASLNFSVATSATAVPIFAFDKADGEGVDSEQINVYSSWTQFRSTLDKDYPEHNYYKSLYLWFMNGGGRCYLVETSLLEKAVGQYDDITLLVAAGSGKDTIGQFNALVSKGYRIFGLLDGPTKKLAPTDTSESIMKDYPSTAQAAVFYPWCKSTSMSAIPPSAVAAAAITQTDRTRGPWKAPANQVINGITPEFPVSNDMQGNFNKKDKSLNMIRTLSGVGTVVWGARTLENSDNWRYIPVRRLFNMVETDIKKALNKVVFEPNSQPTWQKVKAAIDNYLYSLWQQGALAGNNPEEAWFIQIGKGVTMTDDDITNGRMIVKIGLAAVRPAEFIILQFSQDVAQ